jgi:hypothetical protein
MRVLSVLVPLLLLVPPLHAQGDSLSVLAHAPEDTAESGNVVRVIFDRPVAGRVGASIDASRHFRIVPAVGGKLSWRDPITMQFMPAQPFAPGDSFTVTIDTTLYAIDGTHLAQAYRFTFRVPGARLLFRSFGANYGNTTGTLPIDGRIQLLYSAPVDLEALNRGSPPAAGGLRGRARALHDERGLPVRSGGEIRRADAASLPRGHARLPDRHPLLARWPAARVLRAGEREGIAAPRPYRVGFRAGARG